MDFYAVRADYPWGDYGEGSIQGYVWPLSFYIQECIARQRQIPFTEEESQGLNFVVERLGPVAPDLVISSDMFVVKENVKDLFFEAFPDIKAEPLIKGKIVDLPWETWDMNAELPPVAPPGGEPEGYIFENEHSVSASEKMGTLYRLIFPKNPLMVEIHIPFLVVDIHFPYQLTFTPDRWKGEHFLCVPRPNFPDSLGAAITIVSEYGKNWLSEQGLDKFLSFSGALV